MKKIQAVFLVLVLCFTFVACSNAGNEPIAKDDSLAQARELKPAFTLEELSATIDFNAAETRGAFITADQGDVTVSTGRARGDGEAGINESTSFRSNMGPDSVWDGQPINYGNDSFTLPDAVMMPDGSLGSLSIPKIGLMVSVYDAEDEIEAMVHGVAHMRETSCWAGNVGLAGHDSGVNTFFADLHKLVAGDEIILTTALGVRTYRVVASEIVDEYDWSYFRRTEDNRITLLTCVQFDGSKRLIVQGIEVV